MKFLSLLFVALVFYKPMQNADLDSLKNKKAVIDLYLQNHKKELVLLAKIRGRKDLVKVKNGKWPDEVEYSYNVLKDESGKIIYIMQSPVSESGDWDIKYKHYFDQHGHIFAFIKNKSVFNDDIKGGVVRELLLSYYDEKFKLLNQSTKLINKDNKVLQRSASDFDFPDYKYKVHKNLSDCLLDYNIKL